MNFNDYQEKTCRTDQNPAQPQQNGSRSTMANYHVTNPKNSETWKVVKAGADRDSAHVKTQHEAERIAKDLSVNCGGGEVCIHKPNGGPIRDSDTVAPGKRYVPTEGHEALNRMEAKSQHFPNLPTWVMGSDFLRDVSRGC